MEMYIFISYAREDFQAASRLYRDLKKAGLNPCLSKTDIPPSMDWKKIIEKCLEQSRFCIPIFSRKSVNESGVIRNEEIRYALDILKKYHGKIWYVPVRLDDCKLPFLELEYIRHTDLFLLHDSTLWWEGLTRLIAVIKEEMRRWNLEYLIYSKTVSATIDAKSISPYSSDKYAFPSTEEDETKFVVAFWCKCGHPYHHGDCKDFRCHCKETRIVPTCWRCRHSPHLGFDCSEYGCHCKDLLRSGWE